jgi:hypothetical protein
VSKADVAHSSAPDGGVRCMPMTVARMSRLAESSGRVSDRERRVRSTGDWRPVEGVKTSKGVRR